MVYCGRISKACIRCRQRKLRCDLRKDACRACVRAHVPCSGYRDPAQLQVRDESQTIKERALVRKSKVIPGALNISINERARNAFFFRYVKGFSSTFDILEPLVKKSPVDCHLTASVDAASLAFLTFQSDCPQAPRLARQRYLDALTLLNRALVSPECATTDSTLLTVLLLDLFEKIFVPQNHTTDPWLSHLNGALVLIKLRNRNHFQDAVSLRLALRLSTNLLISCVAADVPVPPALVKLRFQIEPYLNKDDPKWQITCLVFKYAKFRTNIRDGHLSYPEIIEWSKELDNALTLLTESMPPWWKFQTEAVERDSDMVFEKRLDVYGDHFITQTWNVLRIMRIFLNDMNRKFGVEQGRDPYIDDAASASPNVSTAIIDTLAREICASAPQLTRSVNMNLRISNDSEIQRLRCYTLIFPLYVAGMYASSQAGVKPWIVKELRFMASNIGIQNANVVADILEQGNGTNPWSVYALLGSYAFAA